MEKPRAMKGYRAPGYPTQEYLKTQPELLEVVPERWKGNELVMKALGGAAALLLAAQVLEAGSAEASRIAPFFDHGGGRAAYGCMAVNPPVFLSEDEARDVVRQEAAKAGLKFSVGGYTVKDVEMPLVHSEPCGPTNSRRGDLELDGYDAKHGVAFEVVSEEDHEAWLDPKQPCKSTVTVVDLRETAKRLRAALPGRAEEPRIGVFYMQGANRGWERPQRGHCGQEADRKQVAEAKERDTEQLRVQVREFIGWLKGQGVI